ncbi:transcriptional adapter 1 [Procambarus clarkii]|uniref:transcriptional adapter 1 n=1 Tax=Procambarus clarkii TaxID=6728 RepID=UPI001E676B6C|nr:transcriptional adapter 1-like [Procambarus clarkii]XP_045616219.1 transcriptional adapter 1-like [Procambarus clarkii]XP_045616221.1 transcriptional adapter 1-like [Procambarus clarkii]
MSLSSSDHLNGARKRLEEALGPDKKTKYFYHMKQWFRMRVTKEEFDKSARDLLPLNSVHLHNEFLLAILTKCQLFTSSSSSSSRSDTHHRHDDLRMDSGGGTSGSRDHASVNVYYIPSERKKLKPKKKMKATRPPQDNNFEAVTVQDIAATATLHEPQAITDAGAGYMSRSLCLLDTGPLKGRLLLAAWDHGITQVADNVANMLQEATQQCLKNVLMAVISRRRGYRIREGRFMHSLGTTPPNPWLRNTASLNDWASESLGLPTGECGEAGDRPIWPTVDSAEQNAAHLAACAPQTDNPLPPISCMDLLEALQVQKSALPCHSVYALGMERISSRLWHPGWGEVEQEAIAVQEASLRETLKEHRLAANPVT